MASASWETLGPLVPGWLHWVGTRIVSLGLRLHTQIRCFETVGRSYCCIMGASKALKTWCINKKNGSLLMIL